MRIFISIATLIYIGNVQATIDLPTTIRGKCYIAEFNHANTKDKNILTICVKNNKATARMIFSNTGALPAVCYHEGTHTVIDDNKFHVDLEKGQCDNNRPFFSDSLKCVKSHQDTFNCKSPKGEMKLKLLKRAYEKT